MSFWGGIIAAEQKLEKVSYYELIGVPSDASATEIDDKYYKLASKFHPDRFAASDNAKGLVALNRVYARLSEAKTILLDPATRREYDKGLANGVIRIQENTRPARAVSQQDPCNPMAQSLLEKAILAASAGEYKSAVADLQLALQFEPSSDTLQRKLEMFQESLGETGRPKTQDPALAGVDEPAQKPKASALAKKSSSETISSEKMRPSVLHWVDQNVALDLDSPSPSAAGAILDLDSPPPVAVGAILDLDSPPPVAAGAILDLDSPPPVAAGAILDLESPPPVAAGAILDLELPATALPPPSDVGATLDLELHPTTALPSPAVVSRAIALPPPDDDIVVTRAPSPPSPDVVVTRAPSPPSPDVVIASQVDAPPTKIRPGSSADFELALAGPSSDFELAPAGPSADYVLAPASASVDFELAPAGAPVDFDLTASVDLELPAPVPDSSDTTSGLKARATPFSLGELVGEFIRIRSIPAHLVLGVSADADSSTVRAAYEELVRLFHPHNNQAAGNSERMDVCRDLVGVVVKAYRTIK